MFDFLMADQMTRIQEAFTQNAVSMTLIVLLLDETGLLDSISAERVDQLNALATRLVDEAQAKTRDQQISEMTPQEKRVYEFLQKLTRGK